MDRTQLKPRGPKGGHNTPMHYYGVWGCCFIPNSGTFMCVDYMDGFTEMGAISLNCIDADRLVVGILEECRDSVALALGSGSTGDVYYVLQLPPARARQLAASLLNKSDCIEGIR